MTNLPSTRTQGSNPQTTNPGRLLKNKVRPLMVYVMIRNEHINVERSSGSNPTIHGACAHILGNQAESLQTINKVCVGHTITVQISYSPTEELACEIPHVTEHSLQRPPPQSARHRRTLNGQVVQPFFVFFGFFFGGAMEVPFV